MICSRVVNWAVAVASVIRMYQHRVSPEPGTLRAVLPIEKAFPNRLCSVLRTQDAEAGFQACLAAMEGGIGSIEITTTVPSCYDMIRGLRASTGDSHPIGVGTVWDPGAVSEAKDAGAAFVVTPVLLPEVAGLTVRRRPPLKAGWDLVDGVQQASEDGGWVVAEVYEHQLQHRRWRHLPENDV